MRACPLCLGRRAGTVHAQPFVLPEGHPLGHGYDVVCCEACGFVYADTGATQAAYDDYYARLSKYEDPRTATGGGHQPWDDARLEETARAIAAALPDRNARVVDVGCANGGVLRHLSRLGFRRLCGVDPSPRCAAAAGSIPGTMGLVGSLLALPPEAGEAGEVDAVVLSHVLEHVQELRRGVAEARRLLRPGGIVYAEVPDATRYADCLAAPFQDFNTEHVNHFGPASLASLLALEGVDVLTVRRKTIAAAAGVPYPAVYAIGRAPAGTPAPRTPPRDDELLPAIHDYVRRSAALMRTIDDGLAPLLDPPTPIVVWGLGQLTFKLLAMTRLADVPIRAFVDTAPTYHGMTLRGAPIVPPEALARYPEPVLIGTLLNGDAIEARLRELGAPNPVLRLATR